MKKIKLEIESLEVVSFVTSPSAAGKGTVLAHSLATVGYDHTCVETTCWRTQDGTCFQFTCYETCAVRDTCLRTCVAANCVVMTLDCETIALNGC